MNTINNIFVELDGKLSKIMDKHKYTHSTMLVEHVRKMGIGKEVICNGFILDVFEMYWDKQREKEWDNYELGQLGLGEYKEDIS